MNTVILQGNLTRDPELKALPNGTSVVNFSIATNRSVKKDDQWESVPEYHNLVAFGKTADSIAKYFRKGNKILVNGRLQTRSWDSEDGKKNYKTEIVIEQFFFCENKNATTQSTQENNTTTPTESGEINYDDGDINPEDIPF